MLNTRSVLGIVLTACLLAVNVFVGAKLVSAQERVLDPTPTIPLSDELLRDPDYLREDQAVVRSRSFATWLNRAPLIWVVVSLTAVGIVWLIGRSRRWLLGGIGVGLLLILISPAYVSLASSMNGYRILKDRTQHHFAPIKIHGPTYPNCPASSY